MSQKTKVLISVGSNTKRLSQMAKARRYLLKLFPDICFTRSLSSPACGGSVGIYSNMLAEFTTTLNETELTALLKQLERNMGDTSALRSTGTVMMDLDLLRYGSTQRHKTDWQQSYIIRLLHRTFRPVCVAHP